MFWIIGEINFYGTLKLEANAPEHHPKFLDQVRDRIRAKALIDLFRIEVLGVESCPIPSNYYF